VRDGVVQSAERHLRRFARSAAMLDLPAPDRQVYREAIAAAVATLVDPSDAYVRFTLSRGDEAHPSGPIGWVYADVSRTTTRTHRGSGRRVLARGYASTSRRPRPGCCRAPRRFPMR